jgi:hypothetical protein
MKFFFVLIATTVLGMGCGKAPKVGHEGHDHGKGGVHEQGPRLENEEATASAKTGPGLAVEAYEVEEGRLKLSSKAEQRLGLKSEKVAMLGGGLWVPSGALGHEDGEPFVYVKDKEGWLKRTFLTLGPRSGAGILVTAGLASGTEVLVEGAPLVRLAELDLLAGDAVASCCVY